MNREDVIVASRVNRQHKTARQEGRDMSLTL